MPKVITSSLFTLKVLKGKEGKASFSVSKKVDKRATKRNRIRRLFRASILNLIGKEKQNNFLFIVKKEALGKTQKELENQIEKVLKKEKLIK